MKLEASGWPKNCKTDVERKQFLEQCRLQDGIELDPAELDKGLNPALRQIAVILTILRLLLLECLSLWNVKLTRL